MQFSQIPGYEIQKSELTAQVASGRVSHAQIFAGGEGSVALVMALAYAQLALCRTPGEDSCGECPSCKQFAALQHPDVHFSFPVAKTKDSGDHPVSEAFLGMWRAQIAENPYPLFIHWLQRIGTENKQAQISVYESVKLFDRFKLKSHGGGLKVLIMWMPEKLNPAAANKLLKLIEEPEGDSLILLVSHHPEDVLGTIRSRCQLTRIGPMSHSTLSDWLIGRGLDARQAQLLTVLSDGQPGQVLQALEHSDFINRKSEIFVEWSRCCFQQNIPAMIQWSERTSSMTREELKSFLRFSLGIFEQAVTYSTQIHQSNPFEMTSTGFKFENFSRFIHPGNIRFVSQSLNRAIRDIERNLSAKLVLLDTSFELSRLLRVPA